MYQPGGPRMEVRARTGAEIRMRARARIEALEVAGVEVGMLLSLIEAPPTSSSLPVRKGLWQVHRPAIWLAGGVDSKGNCYFFERAG